MSKLVQTAKVTVKIKKPGRYGVPRISGTAEQLDELGVTVLGEHAKGSVMWDYEDIYVTMPDEEYVADLTELKDVHGVAKCCDIIFSNGVCFGYVDLEDWHVTNDTPASKHMTLDDVWDYLKQARLLAQSKQDQPFFTGMMNVIQAYGQQQFNTGLEVAAAICEAKENECGGDPCCHVFEADEIRALKC